MMDFFHIDCFIEFIKEADDVCISGILSFQG